MVMVMVEEVWYLLCFGLSLFVGGHGVWSYGYRIIGLVCGWEHSEREKSVFGCKFL